MVSGNGIHNDSAYSPPSIRTAFLHTRWLSVHSAISSGTSSNSGSDKSVNAVALFVVVVVCMGVGVELVIFAVMACVVGELSPVSLLRTAMCCSTDNVAVESGLVQRGCVFLAGFDDSIVAVASNSSSPVAITN